MTVFTTRDVGFAVRDFIEGNHFYHHTEDECTNDSDCFEVVDVSDASNLVVVTSGGQRFTIRIVAG